MDANHGDFRHTTAAAFLQLTVVRTWIRNIPSRLVCLSTGLSCQCCLERLWNLWDMVTTWWKQFPGAGLEGFICFWCRVRSDVTGPKHLPPGTKLLRPPHCPCHDSLHIWTVSQKKKLFSLSFVFGHSDKKISGQNYLVRCQCVLVPLYHFMCAWKHR